MSSRRSSSFMVLGLIARSDLPCVEISAPVSDDQQNLHCISKTIEPTPVILLLLVVVAQFTLTLRGHAALGLQHLFCFIRSWLVSLICVKVLKVRASMGADLIEIANGMMSLGHPADTRVYKMWSEHEGP